MNDFNCMKRVLCVALAGLLVAPPAVHADEIATLTASKDALINEAFPTANDGVFAFLRALSQLAGNVRSLVQFDMTSLDPAAAVKTSTLHLTLNRAPVASRTVAAHVVTGATPWTESGVTWSTRDGATAWGFPGGDINFTPAATQPSGTTTGAVLDFNIRSDGTVANIPQAWLDGSLANNGLLLRDTSENGPERAVLNSVQSGTLTVSLLNSGSEVILPVLLTTTVDPTRSFVLHQVNPGNNSDYPTAAQVGARIDPTGATVEFLFNNNQSIATTLNITWYVVEFSQGVLVQSGDFLASAASPVNVALTPVSATSQAFVLMSRTAARGDSVWDSTNPVVTGLPNTTQAQFRYNSTTGGGSRVLWQVVEFTAPGDILVQRSNTALASGQLTTGPIALTTPVDPARTIVLTSYRHGNAGTVEMGKMMPTAELSGCTTTCSSVTVQRDTIGVGLAITEINYQVIQFGTGATVQGGTQSFGAGVGSISPALSPSVSTTRAFPLLTTMSGGGANFGRTTFTTTDTIGSASFSAALSSGALTLTRPNTVSAANAVWFVAEMNDVQPNEVRPFAREDATPANRPQLDVSFLRNVSLGAITPGISEVTFNWLFPSGSSGANYDGVLIARRDGAVAPTFAPADGIAYTVGQQPVLGETVTANTSGFGVVSVLDENGPDVTVVPSMQYSYRSYTRDNNTITGAAVPAPPHYSFGVNTTATTLAGGGLNKLWSYRTGASVVSAPGVESGASAFVGSNDSRFHSMAFANGARNAALGTAGGAIQARPAVLPASLLSPATDCDPAVGIQPCSVAIAGAADGNAYAFDVSDGVNIWPAPVAVALAGGQVTGGAAVQLDMFSNVSYAPSCGNCDLAFLGSRNTGVGSTTNNQVVAIDIATGGIIWTFAPGNMDVITSTPQVDYATNSVWVTSLSNGATQPSLWRLRSYDGALLDSFSLGDISNSPVLNNWGHVMFVTQDSGTLSAVRTDVASCTTSLAPAAGTAVGQPSVVYFGGFADDIYFTTSATVNKFRFSYTPGNCSTDSMADLNGSGWTNPALTNPGPVLGLPAFVFGAPVVFLGDGTGRLRKLDPVSGAILDSRDVELGFVLGELAIDIAPAANSIYVGSSSGRVFAFTVF